MASVTLPSLPPGGVSASAASTQSAFGAASASPGMSSSTGDIRRAAARLATAPEQRARSTFSAFSSLEPESGGARGGGAGQDFLGRLAMTDDGFRRSRRKTLATEIVQSLHEGSRRECERCTTLQKRLDDDRRMASKELEHLRRGLEKLMDQLSLYLPGPRLTKLVEALQLDVRYLTRPLEGEASPEASAFAQALFKNNQEQESALVQKLKKQIEFLEEELRQLKELAEKCGFGPGTRIGADGFPVGFRKEASTQWIGGDAGLEGWENGDWEGGGGGLGPNGGKGAGGKGRFGAGGGVGPNGEPLDGPDDSVADPETLRQRLSQLRAENARLIGERNAAEEKREEEARLHREALRQKDDELEALRRQLAELSGANGGPGGPGQAALTPEEQAAAEAAAREKALLEAGEDGGASGRRGKEGSGNGRKGGKGKGSGSDSSDEDGPNRGKNKGKRGRKKGKSGRRLVGADGDGEEGDSEDDGDFVDKCVGGGPGPGLTELLAKSQKNGNGKELNKNGKCYLREVRSTPSLGVSLQDGSLSPGPSTSSLDWGASSQGNLRRGAAALLGGSGSEVLGRDFGSCLQKPRRLLLGSCPAVGGWNVGFAGVVNEFDGQLLPLGGKQMQVEPYITEVFKKKSRQPLGLDATAAQSQSTGQ